MKSPHLSAVAAHMFATTVVLTTITATSPQNANAAEINLVAPRYTWAIDLADWPVRNGFIPSGADFTLKFTGCRLSIQSPIRVWWENWANSYWDTPIYVSQPTPSSYRVELSVNHSGNYKHLGGTVVGTACGPGATFEIDSSNLDTQRKSLPLDKNNSVKFNVTDALAFTHLRPMVSSDPQKLFYYTGLTPIIQINGVKLTNGGNATVVDDQDIRISVNSNGAIRVTGKKVGTFNRNLVVKLILE